jgi:nitrile hydratase
VSPLPLEDVATDLPVKPDQLAVHRRGRALPRLLDPRFKRGAQIRWFVVPQRPADTDGSEEQPAALVTPESMMGVALVAAPEKPAA